MILYIETRKKSYLSNYAKYTFIDLFKFSSLLELIIYELLGNGWKKILLGKEIYQGYIKG